MRKDEEKRLPEEMYEGEQNEEELLEEQSQRKENDFSSDHDEEKPQQDETDDADDISGETFDDEHIKRHVRLPMK